MSTGTEHARSAPVAARTRHDPASFRDPASTVVHAGGQVLRGLRPEAVADWEACAASGFFPRLVGEGRIVATEPLTAAEVEAAGLGDDWALVLRHERVPFVSYPFEWTFSMLRDAAALHLELLTAALADDITTKDGSAYNVQWRGARPLFIDVGSFERLRAHEPWAGYRQFCQTFLYPLMLQAHLGVGFQPWLRAEVDGIEAPVMRQLLGGRHLTKPGVLKHVRLHSAIQARNQDRSTREVRGELEAAGFSKEMLLATVGALTKLVDRLHWKPPASHWTDYRTTCTYAQEERAAKTAFVHAALAATPATTGDTDRERPLGLVVDLGANDGEFSRVAAEHAGYVLAVESDAAVADQLYLRLRDEGERRILPLVMDLANPSPGTGWRNRERTPFLERARPDAVLCLALVHHLAIGRNVPLPELVDWLASFCGQRPAGEMDPNFKGSLAGQPPAGDEDPGSKGSLPGRLIVEFVDPADPMARRLLANKPDGLFGDYTRERFEQLLGERFTIERREELPSGTRTLYAGTLRG